MACCAIPPRRYPEGKFSYESVIIQNACLRKVIGVAGTRIVDGDCDHGTASSLSTLIWRLVAGSCGAFAGFISSGCWAERLYQCAA